MSAPEAAPGPVPPLPPEEGLPTGAVDPALDPAQLDGTPALPDTAPHTDTGSPTLEMPAVSDHQETGDGYVAQSREAFHAAQERGKTFARRVGSVATSKFVVFRRKSPSEGSTDTGDEQPKPTWGERIKTAKDRAVKNHEQRRDTRRQERETGRQMREATRVNNRMDKQQEREAHARHRAAERAVDRANKRTMSREEYQDYKLQKRIDRNREIIMKQYNRGVARKEARQFKRDQKAAERMNQKFDKDTERSRKAEERAERRPHHLNAKARRALEDMARHYPEVVDNNDATGESEQQRDKRLQRARRVGAKVLRGAGVVSKVAVGAGVVGGEAVAKHAKRAAEVLGSDDRVVYAKERAKQVSRDAIDRANKFLNGEPEQPPTLSQSELSAMSDETQVLAHLPLHEGAEGDLAIHEEEEHRQAA